MKYSRDHVVVLTDYEFVIRATDEWTALVYFCFTEGQWGYSERVRNACLKSDPGEPVDTGWVLA